MHSTRPIVRRGPGKGDWSGNPKISVLGFVSARQPNGPRLGRRDLSPGRKVFGNRLEQETDLATKKSLALSLTTVASRIGPDAAAKICGATANILVDESHRGNNQDARGTLFYCLSALSLRLPQEDAIKAGALDCR